MSDNVKDYSGASIEVLKGLEPVRRRPGMYTDTQNPNHLGMEVIDNSVDEAVAGFANKIDVVLYEDESLEVTDNGRGMPVDLHPEEKIPAIELILTRLHAGGKFNSDSYKFSGGLHGVGVSVVNALSRSCQSSSSSTVCSSILRISGYRESVETLISLSNEKSSHICARYFMYSAAS